MQQPPLPAVVVEVVDAMADTLCLALNRNLNGFRFHSGPSHWNQAAALKSTSVFLAANSPFELSQQPLSSAYLYPP
jgi:hypothetical protein